MNSKFCEIFVETLKINSGSCGESIWTKRYYSWPWWSVFQPSTSSSDKFQNSSFGWINNMINYESGLVYENQPIINISWDVRRVKEDSFVWYYSFQPFKKKSSRGGLVVERSLPNSSWKSLCYSGFESSGGFIDRLNLKKFVANS